MSFGPEVRGHTVTRTAIFRNSPAATGYHVSHSGNSPTLSGSCTAVSSVLSTDLNDPLLTVQRVLHDSHAVRSSTGSPSAKPTTNLPGNSLIRKPVTYSGSSSRPIQFTHFRAFEKKDCKTEANGYHSGRKHGLCFSKSKK